MYDLRVTLYKNSLLIINKQKYFTSLNKISYSKKYTGHYKEANKAIHRLKAKVK